MVDPVDPGTVQPNVAPTPQVPADAPAQPVTPAPVVTPQAPVAPAPATPAPLPEDTRGKTREQFEKLLESNRRLFETNTMLQQEMTRRNTANQSFAPMQQVPQPPANQVNPADFVEVDPVSGESYINTQKMTARLNELNVKASRAEQAVQNYIKTAENREIERQSKEAFTAYPELNPGTANVRNPKFDEKFNKQVRGVLLDSMYNPDDYGGKPLSFREAADLVKQLPASAQPQPVTATPDAKKEEKAKAEAAEKSKELKAQSSAQVPSQPQNAPQPVNDEEIQRLRLKTRLGDSEALARRLINTEHIVPKEGQST